MLEAVVDPVGDRAVVVEAGEDLVDPGQHIVEAAHVEEGLLLPGKRGIGQVLGGGRRAHRNGQVLAEALLHFRPGVRDRTVQRVGEGGLDDPPANVRPRCSQRLDVVGLQALEAAGDLRVQAGLGQELAERIGGGGEAARNVHPGGGQVGDHFAQRGVLAADLVEVVHAELVEPADILVHVRRVPGG